MVITCTTKDPVRAIADGTDISVDRAAASVRAARSGLKVRVGSVAAPAAAVQVVVEGGGAVMYASRC